MILPAQARRETSGQCYYSLQMNENNQNNDDADNNINQ